MENLRENNLNQNNLIGSIFSDLPTDLLSCIIKQLSFRDARQLLLLNKIIRKKIIKLSKIETLFPDKFFVIDNIYYANNLGIRGLCKIVYEIYDDKTYRNFLKYKKEYDISQLIIKIYRFNHECQDHNMHPENDEYFIENQYMTNMKNTIKKLWDKKKITNYDIYDLKEFKDAYGIMIENYTKYTITNSEEKYNSLDKLIIDAFESKDNSINFYNRKLKIPEILKQKSDEIAEEIFNNRKITKKIDEYNWKFINIVLDVKFNNIIENLHYLLVLNDKLKKLDISVDMMRITSRHINTLNFLKYIPNLTELNISNIRKISDYKGLTYCKLQLINASKCDINQDQIKYFTGIKNLILHYSVNFSNFSDLSGIEVLDISYNIRTEILMETLIGNNLKVLILDYCKKISNIDLLLVTQDLEYFSYLLMASSVTPTYNSLKTKHARISVNKIQTNINQIFKNVTTLQIVNSHIKTLFYKINIPNLKYLSIAGSDISTVHNFEHLKYINISKTYVSKFHPLNNVETVIHYCDCLIIHTINPFRIENSMIDVRMIVPKSLELPASKKNEVYNNKFLYISGLYRNIKHLHILAISNIETLRLNQVIFKNFTRKDYKDHKKNILKELYGNNYKQIIDNDDKYDKYGSESKFIDNQDFYDIYEAEIAINKVNITQNSFEKRSREGIDLVTVNQVNENDQLDDSDENNQSADNIGPIDYNLEFNPKVNIVKMANQTKIISNIASYLYKNKYYHIKSKYKIRLEEIVYLNITKYISRIEYKNEEYINKYINKVTEKIISSINFDNVCKILDDIYLSELSKKNKIKYEQKKQVIINTATELNLIALNYKLPNLILEKCIISKLPKFIHLKSLILYSIHILDYSNLKYAVNLENLELKKCIIDPNMEIKKKFHKLKLINLFEDNIRTKIININIDEYDIDIQSILLTSKKYIKLNLCYPIHINNIYYLYKYYPNMLFKNDINLLSEINANLETAGKLELPNLKILSLSGSNIYDIYNFIDCKNIEKLSLDGTCVNNDLINHLYNFEKLHTIELNKCLYFTNYDKLFKKFPNICRFGSSFNKSIVTKLNKKILSNYGVYYSSNSHNYPINLEKDVESSVDQLFQLEARNEMLFD